MKEGQSSPRTTIRMNNTQLYLAIGLPSAIALIGILVNIGYFVVLNTRMMALEARMLSLETRTAGLEARAAVLDQGFTILLKKFDEARH